MAKKTYKKPPAKKSGPSLYDTTVKDQYGKPVVNKPSDSKKKPYGMASKTSDKKKVVKKVETKKQTTPSKPKVTGNSFLDVATGARSADYYSVKTKPKVTAPTVSQLWKEKTGTSWSEAKSLGLTDGSASANTALMKKLQSGSVNKNTVKSDKAARNIEPFKKEMERNVQDELSGKIKFDEPVPAMRRGGSVSKMRKKIAVKRKK
jgi:hypothetical protein